MAGERLLQNIDSMAGLQGDGDPGRRHFPAGPVNHGCEINKAFGHRDIGRIQRPDLIGSVDPHPPHEIGIYLVTRVFLARSRFPVQRLDTHALHLGTPTANLDAARPNDA